MRVLLVEDSERLGSLIRGALRASGFSVDAVGTGADAQLCLVTNRYDAMILDLGLPDTDGMTIVEQLGARRAGLPVLILTARDGPQSAIDALNRGADDYLRKPFVMDELIARLRALLRRPGQALDALLCEGNVELDTVQRLAFVGGTEAELSRKEVAALELLLRRKGRVVSKRQFEDSLYGSEDEIGANAIEVLLHRLRKKLSGAGATIEIHTLRGIGYLLADERA